MALVARGKKAVKSQKVREVKGYTGEGTEKDEQASAWGKTLRGGPRKDKQKTKKRVLSLGAQGD